MTVWPDEMLDDLRQLAGERGSAQKIADILTVKYKCNITRNAIIGKCHRKRIQLNGVRVMPTRNPYQHATVAVTREESVAMAVQREVKEQETLIVNAEQEQFERELENYRTQNPIKMRTPRIRRTWKNPGECPPPYHNEPHVAERDGALGAVMNLSNGQCKWPVGDPFDETRFHFCCAPQVDGKPYCAHHDWIANWG